MPLVTIFSSEKTVTLKVPEMGGNVPNVAYSHSDEISHFTANALRSVSWLGDLGLGASPTVPKMERAGSMQTCS